MSPADDSDDFEASPTRAPKARVEKPDEMSDEVIDFIGAIDATKRRRMTQHLPLEQVLEVVHQLGFRSPVIGAGAAEVKKVQGAIDDYRRAHDRLFPNWSEVWSVLVELGYSKQRR
jgi:hypothetical protein